MYGLKIKLLVTFLIMFLISSSAFSQESYVDENYQPKRVNKCIDLFEAGQPLYYQEVYGGYEEGLEADQTWGLYIVYDMEHRPLDFAKRREFMLGLVDGGPTQSGLRTPAVIVVLPVLGIDKVSFIGGL